MQRPLKVFPKSVSASPKVKESISTRKLFWTEQVTRCIGGRFQDFVSVGLHVSFYWVCCCYGSCVSVVVLGEGMICSHYVLALSSFALVTVDAFLLGEVESGSCNMSTNQVWFTDAEKGKYFKVLPGHAAPCARYSKQEVKRRKEDDEVWFWFSTSFFII